MAAVYNERVFTCLLYKCEKWFYYAFIICYVICQTNFKLKDFPHMILYKRVQYKMFYFDTWMLDINIFYQIMSDVWQLFWSLDSHPQIKNPPAKFPIPLYPLMLLGKPWHQCNTCNNSEEKKYEKRFCNMYEKLNLCEY